MYRVPPARAWWPAVGAPLERGVRPHRRPDSEMLRTSVKTSMVPRKAASCRLVLIRGRTPKIRQSAKAAATRGVYGLASMAPERLPCTSLCMPSVIPLKKPFKPKKRSIGDGERPARARKTTSGFLSIEANQAAAPSAANLIATLKATSFLIKSRLPNNEIDWNRHDTKCK